MAADEVDLELKAFEKTLGQDSVLVRALRYERDREKAGGLPRLHREDARFLLFAIEDKPHLAIKYISEVLSERFVRDEHEARFLLGVVERSPDAAKEIIAEMSARRMIEDEDEHREREANWDVMWKLIDHLDAYQYKSEKEREAWWDAFFPQLEAAKKVLMSR